MWSKNSSFSDLKIAYDMLFTTSINLAISRSIRGRNSGVDRVCNGKTNHDRRAINRFVKKMGFTRRKLKKRTYGFVGLFLQETTASSSHLSPKEWITRGMEWKTNHKRFITFIVLRECQRCDMLARKIWKVVIYKIKAGTGKYQGKYLSTVSC